ncbi:transposable element Tc3 transposase [Trichonephila clavipes]|nr:transposable element Tc3 transposase [Trichonephila clavipes]
MGAEFLFMDDNDRPHRANIVDECRQSEDVTRMDWPAYSPDLNPIEHVWDMLGRRIAARQPPATYLPVYYWLQCIKLSCRKSHLGNHAAQAKAVLIVITYQTGIGIRE